MRILITGITGLLGWTLQQVFKSGIDLFGIYYPERPLLIPLNAAVRAANVADRIKMENIFEWARPEAVIHTAAVGSVDYAEKNREHTKMVNVDGTKIVGELCEKWGSRLIYISSNAVFDGSCPFYSETDRANPLNYYGELKVEAENAVMGSSLSWAIIRPILMYGWPYPGERGNLVTTWIQSLRQGKQINVVDNVYSKPLYSYNCAEAIIAAVEKKADGVFHVAGRDHVSLYNFANITAEIFGLDRNLINPVPDTFFDELVPRPRDTSFDTRKMEYELGVPPLSLQEGLREMKETERIVNLSKTGQ